MYQAGIFVRGTKAVAKVEAPEVHDGCGSYPAMQSATRPLASVLSLLCMAGTTVAASIAYPAAKLQKGWLPVAHLGHGC
jgi:hypothetical protein